MNRRFSPAILLLAAVLATGTLTAPDRAAGAVMNDYCQVPPYVVQNIPPNVLILLDISGSMLNFAYSDGFQTPNDPTDDNSCTVSAPCTKYNYPGRLPTHRYYGYFDPDQWYTYASNVFTAVGPRTATNPNHYWSGDFLNWLTMRRIDIMRKVLTGGRPSSDKIDGEISDHAVRGLYKRITDAEAIANTPYYNANSSVEFVFNTGNSGTSKFDVVKVSNGNSLASNVSVNVQVPLPVEGVLQTVVGARARVGLEFYHVNDGGTVITDVGKNKVRGGRTYSSLEDTINQINLSRPSTNTPLAESLWTATGYFAHVNSIPGYTSPAGSGPNYANDYSTNNNSDPMNFATGGQTRYPVCQKNFVLLLTDGEPCSDGNLPSALLNYANGISNFNCAVQNCPATSGTTPTPYSFPASNVNNDLCGGTGNTTVNGDEVGVEDVALYMHTHDLRSSTLGLNNISGTQNLTLYTVFAFGKDSTLLKYAAINGGFEDANGNGTPDDGEWDKDGNGVPDTYFQATEGAELEQAVRDAFSGILKRASSGTAASVLASGEGSGANLIQAVFYPRRRFGNDLVWWTGSLQNLWYYVDPFFSNATIREETTVDSKLNLENDYIAQFYYDNTTELTRVRRWVDSNGDGVAESEVTPPLDFERLSSLWEAGKRLWDRDLVSYPRVIKTTVGGTTLTDLTVTNASTLSSYLMPDAGDTAAGIIEYVLGVDNVYNLSQRSRTATLAGVDNVWRLGDIVNSTPRIVASVALNKYDSVYSDTTYKAFISDNVVYQNRGMVFAGGNDGMLHAFRLGKLELSWTGKTAPEKARLTNLEPASYTLGDEAWAFIPKNALPYLKYLKDPDYCHLFYVDLSPYVFDASIGVGTADLSTATRTKDSWRTVLIGGMRTGGACDNVAACTPANNCVKTPGGGATGFSSYFALDVTDPANPSLLWEYSNPQLGFATTGPAVVRINAVNTLTSERDRTLNGEWYVVLGSGPTGPIDNTTNQFLGKSRQNLRFFILNLKTGALVQTIDTGITEAFAGSMINSVADFNIDYQDDAIYVGYVKKASLGSTWTDGGVGRILTKNITPNNLSGWAFSRVIDGIGPVTSSVARLQNRNYSTNWLYFGTGRYFFENPPTAGNETPEIDDATGQRRLIGMKEPCFTAYNTINPACTTTVSFPTTLPDATFPNVTSISNVPVESLANSAGFKGWYIDLDGSASYSYDNTAARLFRSERVITDPLATVSGVVFFTTYKPYGDECALGGKSFLWALRYNSGGTPGAGVLKGKALVQVSTASVEQLDLSTAFQKAAGEGAGGLHKDGRRTAAIEGVPPTAQGLSLLSQPPPVLRLLHTKER